ncbi:MAG: A/G-specific adenine glycosylase [Actinomycetota bacterium]|nr:A/G-specific adenine glycosylase [Actinomycetota bacterium]
MVEAGPVLEWFEANARDLPWRRTRDPWAILVSELMLQQTQVSRVVDRLPRFLRRFPGPPVCAGAPLAAVIDEWSGLGYNRRAVSLHRAAACMVAEHDGRVPDGLAQLLALPGVGPYTARAVRVFAFGLDDAVVDTNVARILARTQGRSLKPAEAQRAADAMVPAGSGWHWNQALLDVGATLCRPGTEPDCGRCPCRTACQWALAGCPKPDPAVGSAGVSGGQSTFVGSDRQGRGRLVRTLRGGPVAVSDASAAMGWSDDPRRTERVLATLIADGLVALEDGVLALPA